MKDDKFTGLLIPRTLDEQDDLNDIQKKIDEYGEQGPLRYRPSKDSYYLDIAKSVCARSTCLKRKYGCVIVNNDEIIATGYNGNPRGMKNCCDVGKCMRIDKPHNSGDYSDCHSVHAEQNAMLSTSRRDMIGATMYLYGEEDGVQVNAVPCPICARMIANSGIMRVVNAACILNGGSFNIKRFIGDK